jgi:RNA polymerase sigma factor (sigma-70 family)
MVDEDELERWFCRDVLPLERSLTHFIRRNWRNEDDVIDLRHDVYELAISAARGGLPVSTRHYLFAIARNHLINRAKRGQLVSFDLVADLESVQRDVDIFETERMLGAREALRRVQAGLEKLSPRVREIVRLRKIDGLNVQETADHLGIGRDAVNHQLMMGMKALTDHMLGGAGRIVRPRFSRSHRNGETR